MYAINCVNQDLILLKPKDFNCYECEFEKRKFNHTDVPGYYCDLCKKYYCYRCV